MLMYAIGKGITDQITKENFEAVEATQKRRPPPATAWCMRARPAMDARCRRWMRAAGDGCARPRRAEAGVYVMSIRRPIIHVVTRPFAKKSSYFWHRSPVRFWQHLDNPFIMNRRRPQRGYCNLSTLEPFYYTEWQKKYLQPFTSMKKYTKEKD